MMKLAVAGTPGPFSQPRNGRLMRRLFQVERDLLARLAGMRERGEDWPGHEIAEGEAEALARRLVELHGDGGCVRRGGAEDQVDGGVEAVELAEAFDGVAFRASLQHEVGVSRSCVRRSGACCVKFVSASRNVGMTSEKSLS